MSVAAAMLAGTALAPAQAQVADLGGGLVVTNDFITYNPAVFAGLPAEITNGTLRAIIPGANAIAFGGNLTDSLGVLVLRKEGTGSLTLSGVNAHSGTTAAAGGTLIAGSATALSSASLLAIGTGTSATVDLNGFNNSVAGLTGNLRGTLTSTTGPAVLTITSDVNRSYGGSLQGQVGITKRGTGLLSFTYGDPVGNASNATGPITLEAGGIRVAGVNALGSGMLVVTGASSFGSTGLAPAVFNNDIQLGAALTLSGRSANVFTVGGVISGVGPLSIAPGGTLQLLGNSTYSGGTTFIGGGRVELGSNAAFGTGAVTINGSTVLALVDPAVGVTIANNVVIGTQPLRVELGNVGAVFGFSGAISGSRDVVITAGGGTLLLSGDNSAHTGFTRVNSGTLALATSASSGVGAIRLADATAVATTAGIDIGANIVGAGGTISTTIDTGAFNSSISGALRDGAVALDSMTVNKVGSGVLTLSNAATGASTRNELTELRVDAGTLNLTGGFAGDLTVGSGATLSGTGTQISGTANLQDGSALAAGDAVAGPGAVGTLTVSTLVLGSGSTSLFDLGALGAAGDLVVSAGNLTLDGTLNVNPLAGWGIGTGSYRLFNYAGTLTDNVLALGGILAAAPADVTYAIDTSVVGQVELTVAYDGAFNWDGNGAPADGIIQGGNGTWAAGTNWTNSDGLFNLAYIDSNAAVANFGGVDGGGTVDVVGVRSFGTLNFTASGYTLNGMGGLDTAAGTINVAGDNTATIAVGISGVGTLAKAGAGTLNLTAANSFEGAVSVDGGTLVLDGSFINTGSTIVVASGATLTGSGSFAGTASFGDGAVLSPGNSPGLLTFGNLNLSNGTLLNYEFGAANTLGGPLNDQVVVTGNLLLDGVLTVTESAGGSFTAGLYNLFTYGALLGDNGVTVASLANGLAGTVQVNANANQVNLIVTEAGSIVLNWDGTDFVGSPAGPQGGAGTWNATNTNWTGLPPGEINATWQNNAVAIFGAPGGAVDVADALAFGGISFQSNGYVLGGAGSLSTNGTTGSFVALNDGLTATINTQITGTGILRKQGGGTLVLGGDNTNSGGVSLMSGTIALTSNTGLGTGALIATGGTTLASGTAPAQGTITLANDVLLNGLLNINLNGTAGDVGPGGVLTLDGNDLVLNGVVTGVGSLSATGFGRLVLNNANTYSGGTSATFAAIYVGNDSALGTGTLTLDNGLLGNSSGATRTLANAIALAGDGTVLGPDDLVLNGVVSGVGRLGKDTASVLTLNAANTYTGGTELLSGTIVVGNSSALGTGVLEMSDGTTLGAGANGLNLANAVITYGTGTVHTGPNSLTLSGVISGAGSIRKTGGGNLIITNANSYAGGTRINAGTVAVANNLALSTGQVTMQDGTTLASGAPGLVLENNITLLGGGTVDTAGNVFTLAGVIDGATGVLTKVGSGNLILAGANTYAGGTNLNAGTLTVTNNSSIGTGALAMAGGTTLAAGAAGVTLANAISTAGVGTIDTGANLFTLDGVISGAGSIAKVGSGTLVLNAANTYAGGTALNAGTIRVGNNTALSTGALAMANGTTLQAGAPSLAVANNISLAGIGTVDVNGTEFALSGVISGTGPLVVVDSTAGTAGVLTLSGTNTYTGGTVVIFTTLQVSSDANLGAASGNLVLDGGTLWTTADLTTARAISLDIGGGTLRVAPATTLTVGGIISGSSLTKSGMGTLVLNGANTYNAGTTLTAGTIVVNNDAALGTGTLTATDGTTLVAGTSGLTLANAVTLLPGTFTVDTGAAPATLTMSGVISGEGGLTKVNTGLLNLTAASTYTGATTVAAGTLNVTGSLASAVTVNSGAALNGTGTVGALSVLAGGSVNPGAPGTTSSATLTVTGAASLLGTYTVNVTAAGADRITAGGPLTLGGTLAVAPTPTFTQFNQTFTVASGSSRTGTFGTVTGLSGFGAAFNPLVEYTATQANIRLAPNSLVTLLNGLGGGTGNARQVASAFDRAVALGYNPQAFFNVYNSGAALGTTLLQMSGEQRATERRVVLDTNRVFRETALDRLNLGLASMAGQQVQAGDADSGSVTFFLRGAGSWGSSDTSGAATAFRTEQRGLLTGIDWAKDGLTIGAMFHYTSTDIEYRVLGGSSNVETTGGTFYAGYRKDGGLVANAGVSVAGARTTGARAITLPTFAQTLQGRTTGTTYQVFGELAYDLAGGANARIEPFARLTYVQADMQALTETGGVAALASAKQSYDIAVTNLGLRVGTVTAGGKVSLNASAAWQRTSGAREATTAIGIPAVGQFGLIQSVAIDPNAILLGADLGFNMSDKARISVGYSGLLGRNNDDHGARATLSFAF